MTTTRQRPPGPDNHGATAADPRGPRGASPGQRARALAAGAGWALALLVAAGCEGNKAPTAGPASASLPVVAAPPATAAGPAPATLAGLHYIEWRTGGAAEGERLPLVFAIHGLGDQASQFVRLFRGMNGVKARVIVPDGPLPQGGGRSWFPTEDRGSEAWAGGIRRAAAQVAAAMKEASVAFPTEGRPVVTGFSQGGMISFTMAVHEPGSVVAAFPLGGWLPPPLWPAKKADGTAYPRLVALHGEADERLPIGPTREAVARLNAIGITAELRGFAGVGHTVSGEMRHELEGLLAATIDEARGAKR